MARNEVGYERAQVVAWLEQRFPEISWREIEEHLPLVVWRSRWDELAERVGLPHSRKHIQNLDSKGCGPKQQEAR